VDKTALEKFGNQVRLRACGICINEGRILLINHRGLYSRDFWAPPGGGVHFGEQAEEALKREFKEECLTNIEVGGFLFACEFVRPPLHAIELFFEIKLIDKPMLGMDPELKDEQILSDLKFVKEEELRTFESINLHGIFEKHRNPSALLELRGFFTIT
jgi:8-oxo-dGTP diphosphatase